MGPLLGGVLTDELELAVDLLPQRPDRRLRRPRHLAARSTSRGPRSRTSGSTTRGSPRSRPGSCWCCSAFDQAADWGFGDPRVIAMLVVAVVLVVAFALIEPRMKASALIPTDVIRNGEFRSACLAVLLMSAVFFATVLYAPQFMEKILGYSALKAGRGDAADARHVRARLVHRRARSTSGSGPKPTITAGALGLAVGPFLLSLVDADSSYGALVAGLAVTGIGRRPLLLRRSRPPGSPRSIPRAPSLAGGLIYMFQIAGGAIGLGITTTIFTLTLRERARRQGRRRRDST